MTFLNTSQHFKQIRMVTPPVLGICSLRACVLVCLSYCQNITNNMWLACCIGENVRRGQTSFLFSCFHSAL